jgi:hypothetical protein
MTAGTAVVVTATPQRTPDQQRQQQAEDARQHHDDARNVRIQAMGERRRDSEPQDRPGPDQNDADDGADHPPTVHRHDKTAIAHQRANSGPATPSQAILSMTDSSTSGRN